MQDGIIHFPKSITINSKVFVAQVMLPAHDHVLYVCPESMQEVRVRWSKFMDMYELEGASRKRELHPYCIYADILSLPLYMEERYILAHIPASAHKTDIGEFIEAMQPVEAAIKARRLQQ